MAQKNIMILIDSLSGGGAELVVSNLCTGIDKKRFKVVVCCLRELGGKSTTLQEMGYDIEVLPEREGKIGKYLRWLDLAKFVKKREIHLIHSHSTGGLIDGAIVRTINHRVRHVHTFHFGNYPHLSKKVLIMERVFSRIPDKLIGVGKEQTATIAKTFHLSEKNIETIWNGIEIPDPAKGPEKETGEVGPDERKVILGSISTLIKQKGIPYLLDAISLLKRNKNNFKLLIAGDGPLKNELEAKRNSLNLTGVVEFMGWVNNAPAVILPKIDIFVQSSLWEAMSMVVLEAMGAGKPVVVTDVGDNRHVIENGRDGIIVPKMDTLQMSREIERLIDDKKLRETLGQNARQKVVAECTVQVMADNYERLYLNLLGE